MLFLTPLDGEMSDQSLSLESLKFSSGIRKRFENVISVRWFDVNEVFYVEPDILILYEDKYVHFITISNGKTLAKVYLVDILEDSKKKEIFYIPSRGTLIMIMDDRIKCFKIHNVENHLNTLSSQEPKQMKLTKMFLDGGKSSVHKSFYKIFYLLALDR